MKAIIQDRYGPPEVLQLRDVDPPAVDDEVLVRVHAASVSTPSKRYLEWGRAAGKVVVTVS